MEIFEIDKEDATAPAADDEQVEEKGNSWHCYNNAT